MAKSKHSKKVANPKTPKGKLGKVGKEKPGKPNGGRKRRAAKDASKMGGTNNGFGFF